MSVYDALQNGLLQAGKRVPLDLTQASSALRREHCIVLVCCHAQQKATAAEQSLHPGRQRECTAETDSDDSQPGGLCARILQTSVVMNAVC